MKSLLEYQMNRIILLISAVLIAGAAIVIAL